MVYRRPPQKGTPNKVKPDKYLNNDTRTEPWSNIVANYEVSGADWARWADFLQHFITRHGGIWRNALMGRTLSLHMCR